MSSEYERRALAALRAARMEAAKARCEMLALGHHTPEKGGAA